MKNNIEILKAKEGDIEFLVELNAYLFYLSKEQFDLTMNPDFQEDGGIRNMLLKTVQNNDGVIYIAKSENTYVGYVQGKITDIQEYRNIEKYAELINLMVLPDHHNKGIGSQLWKKFKDWCKNKKVNRINVNVFAKNSQALKFYRNLGFEDYDINLEMKLQ